MKKIANYIFTVLIILAATSCDSYLKEERLIREAKESSKEVKPNVEGKTSTPDKAEPEEISGVVLKKKEVS